MTDYDRVLAVLKGSGILCLFISLLYSTLKSRGKWESFINYLMRPIQYIGHIFGFLLGTPGLTDEEFLRAQKLRELRLKMLRERNDFCPYCKFNLKSGAAQCDQCGKLFYEQEEA